LNIRRSKVKSPCKLLFLFFSLKVIIFKNFPDALRKWFTLAISGYIAGFLRTEVNYLR
jgi:hypothetical protein